MMQARLDYNVVAPDGLRTVRAFDQYVRKSGLEPGLVELVKLRASLMNGCAYCVDLHAREALAKGETERRLFAVPVWREGPFFTARERTSLMPPDNSTAVATCRTPQHVSASRRFLRVSERSPPNTGRTLCSLPPTRTRSCAVMARWRLTVASEPS